MKQISEYIIEKLHIGKDTKISIFDKFKNIVKGTMGMQEIRPNMYNLREDVHGRCTICFRNPNYTESRLKMAWKLICKDLNEYAGIIGTGYDNLETWIKNPVINKKTLLFELEYEKDR